MRINNNVLAMNAHRQLGMNTGFGAKSVEKLSSGLRINRAGDDAAGLAISEKMRAQIRGLGMASRNSQDAISLVQTAEGALNETHNILQRMRELAVQSSNDTNVETDRDQLQKEVNQLSSEINRIANATEFNTRKLLDGSVSATSDTGTSNVELADQSVTVNYASDVTSAAGNLKQAFDGGAISIDAAGEYADTFQTNTSQAAFIKVVYDSSSQITVTMDNSSAGASMSATDVIEADADGNFVYDNHGVSFTINASDLASENVTAGSSVQIGLTAAQTSVAVANDFANNDRGAVTMTSGITIVGNDENKDVGYISISASSTDAASGAITVQLMSSAGGTVIFEETYTLVNQAAFSYDAHGVSFTLEGTNVSAVSTSYTKALDTENVAVTEDNSLTFQVGANENQTLSIGIDDMQAVALGVASDSSGSGFESTANVTDGLGNAADQYAINISTTSDAQSAITVIDNAINTVSTERAKLGANQNRLEYTIRNLDTSSENLQASESRIRDVDMAKEMMQFTKNNILTQAAQSMLAQANQAPQSVLQLLR